MTRRETFHAIYQCESGDYCREDAPQWCEEESEALAWAEELQAQYQARNPLVTGFRLELW